MGLIAVPNVSAGRDTSSLPAFAEAAETGGCTVVDIHSDPTHNRTVFTISGEPDRLVVGLTSLAEATKELDLTTHSGIHPRLGILDVCPLVPHGAPMSEAVACAEQTADSIARECTLPVYLYGEAARRPETRELPDIRRGGLEELIRRAANELPPDMGPRSIEPRYGVVCVGARGPLIAFNVWIEAGADEARRIAREIRSPRAVRALGLPVDTNASQISINLIDPATTGVDAVYEDVKGRAKRAGARIVATEIVGVPPQRFMPSPEKEAARLLRRPGRSLEDALTA